MGPLRAETRHRLDGGHIIAERLRRPRRPAPIPTPTSRIDAGGGGSSGRTSRCKASNGIASSLRHQPLQVFLVARGSILSCSHDWIGGATSARMQRARSQSGDLALPLIASPDASPETVGLLQSWKLPAGVTLAVETGTVDNDALLIERCGKADAILLELGQGLPGHDRGLPQSEGDLLPRHRGRWFRRFRRRQGARHPGRQCPGLWRPHRRRACHRADVRASPAGWCSSTGSCAAAAGPSTPPAWN